ncbi:MAG: hypothetical protein PUH54_02820 [Oscillospiraceae bacterium]|nr:hypothetical protein [Oscillospiraceae bacterium]
MLMYALILGAVAVAVCTLLDKFYDEFAKWLQTLPDKLRDATPGILIGCKTFVDGSKRLVNGTMKQMVRNYSKNGNQWLMTTAEKDMYMDEFPEEIVDKTECSEDYTADITDEMEMWLEG